MIYFCFQCGDQKGVDAIINNTNKLPGKHFKVVEIFHISKINNRIA